MFTEYVGTKLASARWVAPESRGAEKYFITGSYDAKKVMYILTQLFMPKFLYNVSVVNMYVCNTAMPV